MPNLSTSVVTPGWLTTNYGSGRNPPIGQNASGKTVAVVTGRKLTTVARTSVNTPEYLKKVLGGITLPMNPFSYVETITSYPYGKMWSIDNGAGGWAMYTGVLTGTIGPTFQSVSSLAAAELASLDRRAITDLLLQIKDQKVNLVQAVAERRRTAQMIADTVTNIANMIRNLKKGNLQEAAKNVGVVVSKRSHNAYKKVAKSAREQAARQKGPGSQSGIHKAMSAGVLQLRYGWQPLLQDIYGSAQLIAQKQFPEEYAIAHSKKSARVSSRTKTLGIAGSPYTTVRTSDLKCTVSYSVRFDTADNAVHTMSQVGLLNPALIAWELLPWSFVIDWFIPVGNYISSFDATLGMRFIDGCKTTFYKGSTLMEAGGTSQYFRDSWQTWCGSSLASQRKISCVRTKLTSFPSSRLPSFKNPLSFVHVENAIALLIQLRK